MAFALGGCTLSRTDVEAAGARTALALDPPVVISQIYGGGGNGGAPWAHDFVELFNRSDGKVELGALSLQYTSATGAGNFGANASQLATFPPGAVLAPGGYYLLQLGAAAGSGSPLPAPDHRAPIMLGSTSGKIALVRGTDGLGCNGAATPCDAAQTARILDLVGFGSANFFEAAPVPALGNVTAAVRRGDGCVDSNDNRADFELLRPMPRNAETAAAPCSGDRAPFVAMTTPARGAVDVSPSAIVAIRFSEPVVAADGWFAFTCGGTPVTTSVAGGPTVFTLTPATELVAGEGCAVQIDPARITDVDEEDPPDAVPASYSLTFAVGASRTPLAVHAVQGAAHLSPYAGQTLNVGPAIVTALTRTGFFMQGTSADRDDATSEGIFVFTNGPPAVLVGDEVSVVGTITEHRPGCGASCSAMDAAFDNLTTTQIDRPSVSVLGTGRPLPSPVALGSRPSQRAVPLRIIAREAAAGDVETGGVFTPEQAGIDFYESLEGMRVAIERPQVVDPTRSFASGDSREIGVLARPDAGPRTARGGLAIAPGDFNPERVFLSNLIVPAFPSVDVGDSFDGSVVGVVDYAFANFKVLVTEPLPDVVSGGLTRETTALAPVSASQLTIASLNVENLDARDASEKFSALAEIVVSHLASPDLVALEEVQDDDGSNDAGVVGASATLNALARAIAARGGPRYAFRQIDPVDNQDGGESGGNIRVVFMFRTDRGLAFIDRGSATATTANRVDATGDVPRLAFSPGRIEPGHAAFRDSRKPLAGEFRFGGETLLVIAAHFNSKGGDDPLFGRFQPPVLASEPQRIDQATVVADFTAKILAADPAAFVVVLGDLNDFGFSPPLEVLRAGGLAELGDTLPPSERYSYVFQGNSQDLDHILVSPALAARARYDIVHVNAEFATQASDHDPSIVRIDMAARPHCRARY